MSEIRRGPERVLRASLRSSEAKTPYDHPQALAQNL